MGKQKKKSGGSLKGFILLLAIAGAVLYFYQNQSDNTSMQNLPRLGGKIEETLGKVKETVQKQAEKAHSILDGAKEKPSAFSATSDKQQLEIPICASKQNEIRLNRTGYTVSYNNSYKTPYWVAWELTRPETSGKEKRKNKFMPDPDLPEPRAEHSDYTHSGYDRGHMAPAADMKWSAKAMEESFYMSNICPQNRKLNRDDWGDLEETCRDWAKKYGTVYITCGPIYDTPYPKRIGKHQIAVPDRFFKVTLLYCQKTPTAMGFLFENKANHQKLEKYMVPVDSIERLTGLDFFSQLPDNVENVIESIIPQFPARK